MKSHSLSHPLSSFSSFCNFFSFSSTTLSSSLSVDVTTVPPRAHDTDRFQCIGGLKTPSGDDSSDESDQRGGGKVVERYNQEERGQIKGEGEGKVE